MAMPCLSGDAHATDTRRLAASLPLWTPSLHDELRHLTRTPPDTRRASQQSDATLHPRAPATIVEFAVVNTVALHQCHRSPTSQLAVDPLPPPLQQGPLVVNDDDAQPSDLLLIQRLSAPVPIRAEIGSLNFPADIACRSLPFVCFSLSPVRFSSSIDRPGPALDRPPGSAPDLPLPRREQEDQDLLPICSSPARPCSPAPRRAAPPAAPCSPTPPRPLLPLLHSVAPPPAPPRPLLPLLHSTASTSFPRFASPAPRRPIRVCS
nr:predicted GPI-anchored protein 58 [Lolium perenne]